MTGDQFADYRDNDIVRGSDFWGLLGEQDRTDLLAAARPQTFPSDRVLCTQGEPTTHVFILLSGWIKVITVTHDGREILEALRREGEVVGEMAGHLTGYRTATMQALGTVRALLIGAEQFGDYLDLHPLAAHAYRQAMAEVQQVAYEKQRDHSLLSGAQRLAGLLLDLTERRGQPHRDARPLPPPLSQEELASLISASRSTVTRALQTWRSRRIIGTDARRVEILDREQLQRIARRDPEKSLSAQESPSSSRMRRKNADHRAAENASTMSGERESRTSTDRSSRAISTQLPWSALKLLLRQFGSDCRLGRLSIQRPSVRRSALRLAAVRDGGVDLGQQSAGPTPPALCRRAPLGV
jgi:CRP-like cAMP-binding protein